MTQVSIISQDVVKQVVTRRMAYDAIQGAFEALADGQAEVLKVAFGQGFNSGESYGVKMGADRAQRNLGLKIGSYWPGNGALGLPAHGSTIVLIDPATGFPEAIVGAAYLNGFRTAAADAIAVNHLARADASVLGVIGAGHQAEHEIRAVMEVRELELIRVSTRSEQRAAWLAGRLQDIGITVEFTTAETAVRDADIVITVTPSREAIVQQQWVRPGTHVSAMGADASGKQELDPDIVAGARLFADYPHQSVEIGEFQHAYSAGQIRSVEDIVPLGKVSQSPASGRRSNDEVTVFDSSGIAIQDLSIARAVLDEARARGLDQTMDL
jgi:ornithine cyclodeaminase